MVDYVTPEHARRGSVAQRSLAFQAAGRHSARVRWLRRLIVAGSVLGLLGFLVVLIFDPFSKISGKVSISSATFNGSKITMELPKLSGFRADGRPYDVRAASGIQDVKFPNIIELNQIEAKFTTGDNTVIRLVSLLGTYDSSKDFMHFTKDVRITSETGYDALLKSADMDFKAGTVSTTEPVTVATRNFTIASDQMNMRDNGNMILFAGHVRSTLLPTADEPDQKAQVK